MQWLKTALRAWDKNWRETWVHDLDAPGARRKARLDMVLFDHAFLRRLWRNRHEIAPGVWRSNQPSPAQIDELAAMGIKTIINLRGASTWGTYLLQKEACARHGIALIDARLLSRMPPTPEQVETLFEAFETAERPLLMHCKSGADRAGLGAALYLIWAGGTAQEAARELSARYLHFRQSKTGVLDAFIAQYGAAHAETGVSFRDWLHGDYDKWALVNSYKSGRFGSFLVDRILHRE